MIRGTNSFHEQLHISNPPRAASRSTATDIPNALVTAPKAAQDSRWITTIRGRGVRSRGAVLGVPSTGTSCELEDRLSRSRDVFASALAEYDDTCMRHDGEMDSIRDALLDKLSNVPVLETYRQVAIGQQKAKDWKQSRPPTM